MPSIEQIDVDKVLAELKQAAATATNEEELRIKASAVLESGVISKLGIAPGKFEYTFVSGGRLDALYGHLIIEYKAPGKLSKEPDIVKAKEQLIGYIKKEAEVEDRFKLFLGVMLADKIAFVRYDVKTKNWLMRGPYDLNRETVLRFVEALRGLRRKKLAVDELLRDFGPRSMIATKTVKVFYNKLIISKSPKVEALFNDWKRLFSQVCAYSPGKLKGLETEYEIGGTVDYNALLFAIHTYYALLMKLLAAEVAYLFGAGKWLKSYVTELEDAHMKGLDDLKRALQDLESGGVFRKLLNITNFIEGDYFSWYLEELDHDLANAISDIAKCLADYEPATPVLEPEYTRDLLKRLYQNLVPKKIRHNLGEYYTPDWLAELLLNEVGLTAENLEELAKKTGDLTDPLNLKVLDPACGSGTFLILIMKRFREYAEEHYMKDVLASYVLNNVVGFDLNPLSVLTARTNYLLAIADLLGYVKGPIEIPIYLADSLLVETKATLTGISYVIRTYVGVFELPKTIVDKGILSKLLEAMDRYVRLRYKVEDFRQVVKGELNLEQAELQLAGDLFKTFLKLEEEGKNHVWTSIIKNAFAPLTITSSAEKFEYVIGNPPWINWENLPEYYRENTKDLWDYYRLLKKTKGIGLGKVKKDMAMLFVARCLDRFTKNGGKFAFLVPFTAFKTQAGAGFREFLAKGKVVEPGVSCNVLKVHDLVTLYPFEGATNRTSLIIIEKKGKTEFPIPCSMWYNPKVKGIDQEAGLEEVKNFTRQFNLVFIPIEKNNPKSPWMQLTEKSYKSVKRVMNIPLYYKANAGVLTAINGVYWVKVMSTYADGVLVRNLENIGKKKVSAVKEVIESDLIYSLARGRDHKKWYVKPSAYIVLPVDRTGKTFAHSDLRVKYPKAYQYFTNFFEDLVNRGGEPFKSKLAPYRKKKFPAAEKIAPPFYWLFNVSPSLTQYKVVWKEIAGKITGKGEFSSAVIGPIKDDIMGRELIVVPDHKLMLIPASSEVEAYYISGVLNFTISQFIVASYTIETTMDTHILNHVKVPKFDSNNPLHQKISEFSKKAHALAKEIYEGKRRDLIENLKQIEEKMDKIAAQLYGITDEELKEIGKILKFFRGEI